MLLPLVLEDGHAINLRDAQVTDENDAPLQGELAWITWGNQSEPHWTLEPRGLMVEPASHGELADDDRRLCLLVRIPSEGSGPLFLGDQRLRPIWKDIPVSDSDRGGRLTRTMSPARPDPNCPFEYWRWVILAEQFAVEPPDMQGFDELQSMIAEHYADLWSIGLHRLAQYSPGAVGQVREALTRICMDGDDAFAAWANDPAELSQLLSRLLNVERPIEDVAAAALRWVQVQQRPLVWIEAHNTDEVRLAMVNPALDTVVARLSWVLDDDVPIAVELPPGRLTRVRIDLPSRGDNEDDHAGRDANIIKTLRVLVGDWEEYFAFESTFQRVQPPGLIWPPLEPALTLASVRTGLTNQVPLEAMTTVQLRRRAGRWEMFIENRRPGGESSNEAPPSRLGSVEEIRGYEAVTLFIGDEQFDDAIVRLVVPESGWHQLLNGENDGTLQIHRRSFDDRWYCRIVLPDAWLNALFAEDVTSFGVMRSQAGESELQFGPYPSPPWRAVPGTMAVNVAQWLDLPEGQ